ETRRTGRTGCISSTGASIIFFPARQRRRQRAQPRLATSRRGERQTRPRRHPKKLSLSKLSARQETSAAQFSLSHLTLRAILRLSRIGEALATRPSVAALI